MDRGGWWATAHGVANRWTLTKHKQAQATNTSIPSIPMWPGAVLIPRASRPVGIIESRGFVESGFSYVKKAMPGSLSPGIPYAICL